MSEHENPNLEIETLSDDDLESVSGGMAVDPVENTASGTCFSSAANPCKNTGSGTCRPDPT
jgi:bacteriocin-like protein